MIRFLRYIPAFVVALLIAILSLIENPSIPPLGANSDKVLHGIMYAILAMACVYSQTNGPIRITTFLLSFLFSTVWGGIIELLQSYCTVTRTGDWADAVANAIGAGVGCICIACLLYLWNRKSSIK